MNEAVIAAIHDEVKTLYAQSQDDSMRVWFFAGHVVPVVHFVREIAKAHQLNPDIALLAAYYHDIARAVGYWDEPELMQQSLKLTREALRRHGFDEQTYKEVADAIEHHACRQGPPPTIHGQILSSADALAHLMTDFYLIMGIDGYARVTPFNNYRKWVAGKIERDFDQKIFFNDFRALAKPHYEALKLLFHPSV